MEVELRQGVNDQHGQSHPSNQVTTGTTQILPIRLKLAIPVGRLMENLQDDLINASCS